MGGLPCLFLNCTHKSQPTDNRSSSSSSSPLVSCCHFLPSSLHVFPSLPFPSYFPISHQYYTTHPTLFLKLYPIIIKIYIYDISNYQYTIQYHYDCIRIKTMYCILPPIYPINFLFQTRFPLSSPFPVPSFYHPFPYQTHPLTLRTYTPKTISFSPHSPPPSPSILHFTFKFCF